MNKQQELEIIYSASELDSFVNTEGCTRVRKSNYYRWREDNIKRSIILKLLDPDKSILERIKEDNYRDFNGLIMLSWPADRLKYIAEFILKGFFGDLAPKLEILEQYPRVIVTGLNSDSDEEFLQLKYAFNKLIDVGCRTYQGYPILYDNIIIHTPFYQKVISY